MFEFTEADAGYWVAGSSHNTADEVSARTVLLALSRGWSTYDAGDLRTLAESVDGWLDADDGMWLYESAWDAVEYLSTLCPDGYYFEFDDGLVMRSDNEEENY